MRKGDAGEVAAEIWFGMHGWEMVRTQPPIAILGMVTPVMVGLIRSFYPRLAAFGHMVIARVGKGGVADYTGHHAGFYRACEVKEADGNSCPPQGWSQNSVISWPDCRQGAPGWVFYGKTGFSKYSPS